MYEIVTRDDSLLNKPHEQKSMKILYQPRQQHPDVKRDYPVKAYQDLLHEWVRIRSETTPDFATAPTKSQTCPLRPELPPKVVHATTIDGEPCTYNSVGFYKTKVEIERRGGQLLTWQRPAQSMVDGQTRLLSTGKAIKP